MFEQGDGTKLNDEVIGRILKKFGIELPKKGAADIDGAPQFKTLPEARAHTGFCPNPHCPGHVAYEVDGRILLSPDRAREDPVGGKFCALCGEVLERRCPNCGAPVHDGAVCSLCGERYVS